MFSLICARINGCMTNREAGDLRRHRAHCDVTVMANVWMFHQDVMTWARFPHYRPIVWGIIGQRWAHAFLAVSDAKIALWALGRVNQRCA